MIRIQLEEPNTQEWKKWRKRCDAETKLLVESIQTGPRRDPKPKLYAEMKKVLMEMYNHKCAYCETTFPRNSGDLDHYRPKKRVKDEKGHIVHVTDDQGNEVQHPGYYWLTYDWRNLLPSCEHCNRSNTGKQGERQGKVDLFPVEGEYAWKPGAETDEKALLLYPSSNDPAADPESQLVFDHTGTVGGKTEAATLTIKILGLNDEPLIDFRREAYKRAKQDACTMYRLDARDEDSKEAEKKCRAILRGKASYSAIAKIAIMKATEKIMRRKSILEGLGPGGGSSP